ncbi:MAG: hypothetical protein MHPSP_000515 [Paramarteilia canceri]
MRIESLNHQLIRNDNIENIENIVKSFLKKLCVDILVQINKNKITENRLLKIKNIFKIEEVDSNQPNKKYEVERIVNQLNKSKNSYEETNESFNEISLNKNLLPNDRKYNSLLDIELIKSEKKENSEQESKIYDDLNEKNLNDYSFEINIDDKKNNLNNRNIIKASHIDLNKSSNNFRSEATNFKNKDDKIQTHDQIDKSTTIKEVKFNENIKIIGSSIQEDNSKDYNNRIIEIKENIYYNEINQNLSHKFNNKKNKFETCWQKTEIIDEKSSNESKEMSLLSISKEEESCKRFNEYEIKMAPFQNSLNLKQSIYSENNIENNLIEKYDDTIKILGNEKEKYNDIKNNYGKQQNIDGNDFRKYVIASNDNTLDNNIIVNSSENNSSLLQIEILTNKTDKNDLNQQYFTEIATNDTLKETKNSHSISDDNYPINSLNSEQKIQKNPETVLIHEKDFTNEMIYSETKTKLNKLETKNVQPFQKESNLELINENHDELFNKKIETDYNSDEINTSQKTDRKHISSNEYVSEDYKHIIHNDQNEECENTRSYIEEKKGFGLNSQVLGWEIKNETIKSEVFNKFNIVKSINDRKIRTGLSKKIPIPSLHKRGLQLEREE